VTPLIYISMAMLLIFDLAYLAPATSGIGFMLVLSGIPVYFLRRSRAVQPANQVRVAMEVESSSPEASPRTGDGR
jgi:APA family basic amino acid/polyamine antiporter